jgi:NADPH:quinone reductase-like Zn-dependent oxidoreductase
MRAYAIDTFGLDGSFHDLPDPTPVPGEVLVRVHAAGLSTTDLAVMVGYMKDFAPHSFPLVPGIDVSGVVEAVGPGVTEFAVGDAVCGFERRMAFGGGTWAELTVVPVDGLIAKPATLSHPQAAVIAHGSLTALAALTAADLKPEETVVILGATGGVGSYATQLASAGGARVIAVTLAEHKDYARSLGADEVIDYKAADPTAALRELAPDGIDAVVDFAGIPELSAGVSGVVHKGGRVVSVVIPPDVEALAANGVTGIMTDRTKAEARFPEVMSWIVDGKLDLPAIQTFPFEAIESAIGLQATRHVRGKLVAVME